MIFNNFSRNQLSRNEAVQFQARNCFYPHAPVSYNRDVFVKTQSDKEFFSMSTPQQERKRLRISDQDALLKWCRSNGFSLNQKQDTSTLVFDITRRDATIEQNPQADFCLDVTGKGFRVRDSRHDLVAQGKELREVLKQLSLHLAGRHSAAS